MELCADLTQRFEHFRGQHDDGQADGERYGSAHQSHAYLNRNQRHGQSSEKFQDASRQEGDRQRCHRGARIFRPQALHMRHRAFFTPQASERGQARHQVKQL